MGFHFRVKPVTRKLGAALAHDARDPLAGSAGQGLLTQRIAGVTMAAACGSPPFRCLTKDGGSAFRAFLRLFFCGKIPSAAVLAVTAAVAALTQLAAIAAGLDHLL